MFSISGASFPIDEVGGGSANWKGEEIGSKNVGIRGSIRRRGSRVERDFRALLSWSSNKTVSIR